MKTITKHYWENFQFTNGFGNPEIMLINVRDNIQKLGHEILWNFIGNFVYTECTNKIKLRRK